MHSLTLSCKLNTQKVIVTNKYSVLISESDLISETLLERGEREEETGNSEREKRNKRVLSFVQKSSKSPILRILGVK
jgi:hypothetical protein